MKLDDLPLWDVFSELHTKADMPLGVDDYVLALHALRLGLGWQSLDQLKQLCCLLWAKSAAEEERVKRTIDRLLSAQPVPLAPTAFTPDPVQAQTSALPQPDTGATLTAAPTSPATTTSSISAAIDLVRAGVDPTGLAQNVRQRLEEEQVLTRPALQLRSDYFPVTRRQMKQLWRHLRRPVREGPPKVLDVEATVHDWAERGLLLAPVLVPQRVNRARIMLLIDWDGSMVPFHGLSRYLIETVQAGGQLRQTTVYYFHDCPNQSLYAEPQRVQASSIGAVLAQLDWHTSVLIVSDAGAARRSYDQGRVDLTRSFVAQVGEQVRRCAWLNPLPSTRWEGTSADQISRFVPMFALSREGMDSAIALLQGRHIQGEKPRPWTA